MLKSLYIKLSSSYSSLSAPVKASFWFLVCSIIIKCFSMISTPIFTRILTVEEYGKTANFYSWYDLLYPFVTLYLSGVAYNNVLIKHEDDRNRATFSLMTLALIVVFFFFIIYIIADEFWNSMFDITTPMMCIMFLHLLSYPIVDFWSAKERFDYKYKKLVFVSLFITILGVIIGILGVVYSKYKYEFRVSSPIFVTTFIGIILYLNTYKQADYKFTTKYWKYALVLSIPLLPHYLSIKILNQVDRVMITQMVGLSETGLYNLACTVSNLMIIATDAINRSMCPYVYKSIKNKNILPVRKMTSSILLVVMVVSFLEMLIAPELIKIFATDDYLDAIYVIPPVAMSIYFIFLYVVFANVEFYFEKTIFATIVSGIAAVMNIGMNYIFLKKYGYYAAGYTTLICYMLFALLHYWNYKRILKREPYLNGIFDIRHVLLISFSGLALMGICLLLYRYSVIRFSLVIIIITISFYFRNQLKSIIKTSNN